MTQRYYYRPFGEIFNLLEKDLFSGINEISEARIYDSKFPPCDVKLNEENLDLLFEFALAGFSQEEIDISFEDDYMILSVDPKEKKEDTSKVSTLMGGIKRGSSRSKYFVPFTKYDSEKAKASFKNGILSVSIPVKEERKPKKLLIQG